MKVYVKQKSSGSRTAIERVYNIMIGDNCEGNKVWLIRANRTNGNAIRYEFPVKEYEIEEVTDYRNDV